MRRSTKIAILRFFFILIILGAAAYIVMFSGILNKDKYKYLPVVENRNIYNTETKELDDPLFNSIFLTFAEKQLPGKNISQVLIYDRKDNLMNATSNIFCEIHTLGDSIECVTHVIITVKVSADGQWFYKTFSYDSQFNDSYFPYKNISENEIRMAIMGRSLNISEKEITLTEDNLLEFKVEESDSDITDNTDIEKVFLKISSDLLEYSGTVTLTFDFLGSSWDLNSLTVGEFSSDYQSNVKPDFSDDEYKEIFIKNPYTIKDTEYTINFTKDSIQNIKKTDNVANIDGDVYTQNISFDVITDSSKVIMSAQVVFDKSADGWKFRKIDYTHKFDSFDFNGSWIGDYGIFVTNPNLEEFTPEDEKKLSEEEKAEKEKIEEENAKRASKVKTDVNMTYIIEGKDELGYLLGTTLWAEYIVNKDGQKEKDLPYETGFTGEFKEDTLDLKIVLDEIIPIGDKYSSFSLYYDFVKGCFLNKTTEFKKQKEEVVEETEDDELTEDTDNPENTENSENISEKDKKTNDSNTEKTEENKENSKKDNKTKEQTDKQENSGENSSQNNKKKTNN